MVTGGKKTPPKFTEVFFFGVCVWRWGNEGSEHLIKSKLLWLFRSYTRQRRKATTLWNTHALQIMKPVGEHWARAMDVLAKGKDYRKDYVKKLKAAAFGVIFGFFFFCWFFCVFVLFILFCFQSKQMICKASRSSDGKLAPNWYQPGFSGLTVISCLTLQINTPKGLSSQPLWPVLN